MHWLPVRKRVDFMNATLVYRSLSGTWLRLTRMAADVVCRLKKLQEGRRQLRSVDSRIVSSGRHNILSAIWGIDVSRLPALRLWKGLPAMSYSVYLIMQTPQLRSDTGSVPANLWRLAILRAIAERRDGPTAQAGYAMMTTTICKRMSAKLIRTV